MAGKDSVRVRNRDSVAQMVAAFTSLGYGLAPRNGGFVTDAQLRYTPSKHFKNANNILKTLLRTAKTKTERAALSANIKLIKQYRRNPRG
jgi:hypothetical protein